MEKINKYGFAWLIGVLILGIYVWGAGRMYFHQDDLDWFLLVNRPWREVLAYPIGDHVNYLFRLLMYLEWKWFGFNFPPYLLVSVLMHAAVTWLIYLIGKISSGRRDLAVMAALLFSINTNWTEVVLWISGQTISITALFILVAMHAIWKKKGEELSLLLASWTSALALGLLGATVLTYKHLRWSAMLILGLVGVLYLWRGGDGTSLTTSLEWMGQVVLVAGLMFFHTVIGRMLIPFDRFEMERLILIAVLGVWGWWWYRKEVAKIWQDVWSRFLLWQLASYYLIVAAGRAQFGIGIMRAERYGYIGLALLLLLLVRVFRNAKLGKWVWLIAMIVCLQVIGLYVRARGYIERPQQLKLLVHEMRNQRPSDIAREEYLPRFVLQDDRLTFGDLQSLINH